MNADGHEIGRAISDADDHFCGGSLPNYSMAKVRYKFPSVGNDHDVIAIFDAPDNVTASALALGASASGLVRTKVTPLLTVEEVDQVVKKSVGYRPPK